VVSRVLASRVTATVVVTGHQADLVNSLLEKSPSRLVFNPDYRSGMGSSLISGIDYWVAQPDLSSEAGFLVVLGDQPFISPEIIDRVIEAYQSSQAEIVVPVNRGRRGHPPIFHRCLTEEIRKVAGRWGAREVLRRYPEKILPVEVESEEILQDIDTLEDWGRTYASN
jgi:molybdenum cofactor cytidylyltransferase